MKIEVLLLANSKKLGGRCLAGLRTDDWTWFRPVSGTQHGAISTKECEVVGGILRPLDLITCDVTRQAPSPHQAENWLVQEGSIQLISHVEFSDVEAKLGEASELFPHFIRTATPSIPPSFFQENAIPQSSLALIEVDSAVIDETSHIKFKHRNLEWNLKLTDEHFTPPNGKMKIGPAFLCMSVGEYWQKMDAHWKFVAGIIPISKRKMAVPKKGQVGTVAELSIALFGAKPILAVPRFSTEGWFYQGHVEVECPICNETNLHSFRKHYLNNGNTAHYWAIICQGCKTAKELADFDKVFIKRFKVQADKENSPSTDCKECG